MPVEVFNVMRNDRALGNDDDLQGLLDADEQHEKWYPAKVGNLREGEEERFYIILDLLRTTHRDAENEAGARTKGGADDDAAQADACMIEELTAGDHVPRRLIDVVGRRQDLFEKPAPWRRRPTRGRTAKEARSGRSRQ